MEEELVNSPDTADEEPSRKTSCVVLHPYQNWMDRARSDRWRSKTTHGPSQPACRTKKAVSSTVSSAVSSLSVPKLDGSCAE